MTANETAAPARRADAQRNRARILDVARQTCLDDNNPSMASIARNAGLGMATLYRNFADKQELLEELFRSDVDVLCVATTPVSGDTRTPGEAFVAWLQLLKAASTEKAPLAAVLQSDFKSGQTVAADSRARVLAAGNPLYAAAQRSGEVRDDVTLREIVDAVVAIARIPDDSSSTSSMVDVLLDGLQVRVC